MLHVQAAEAGLLFMLHLRLRHRGGLRGRIAGVAVGAASGRLGLRRALVDSHMTHAHTVSVTDCR